MKKKMFIAGMSLAIALVLLATASFAWFTISTAPEVKGMNMALYTNRTLLLAAGDGTDVAPDSDEFNQYISLSSDFAGLAPLRPVSTADGINWFLPAYNTADGTLSEVGNFILDDSLEYANASVVDASGQPLTGDALLAAQSRGYYVYTDIWMKTEEDGAKVRLSVPHSVGTTEERHAGTVTEYGLDAEELTKAVYGTYVLGEPELDENDSNKLKVRTEEPETALRVGFLIYQDSETLEPIAEDSDAALCFKIFEPNANKRAAGLSQDLWIPGKDGSTEVTREQYIAGSTVSTLQSNTYYVTQPIGKSENGQITLTTVPAENMIVQLSSEWDESAVIKTMNGLWGNSIKKPSSNDVKTFGQFLKLNDAFATANNEIDLSDLTDMTDIAGNNLVVELKKDTPIRVRLFVWLEGQDVDCWNDIATGTFRINLELAGESIVKPEAGDEPGREYTLSNNWASYSEKNGFTSLTFTRDIPGGYDRKWNVGADDGVVNAYACGSDAYIVVPQNGILYLPQNCNELFAMRLQRRSPDLIW